MLELMGLTFTVILFCAFLGGVFGVFWMRGQLHTTSVVGVLQRTLENVEAATIEASPDSEWYHAQEADLLCAEYESLGAESMGLYSIPDIDGICLQAFTHSDLPAYITVNDHPDYGCWSDIVMLPESGGSLTFTTVQSASTGHNRPAIHRIERCHQSSHPQTMLGFARSRLLDESFKPAGADQFIDVFNAIMADCQQALEDQDVDQSMLESLVKDSGIVLQGDEAETINADRQLRRHDDTLRQCMQSYASSSGLTAQDWEMQRESIIVVYENYPVSLLLETLFENFTVPESLEDELAALDLEQTSARSVASRFIAALPEEYSAVRVATLSDPVLADVYKKVDVEDSWQEAA